MSDRHRGGHKASIALIGIMALILGAGCAPADSEEGAGSSTLAPDRAVTSTSQLTASETGGPASTNDHRTDLEERLVDLPLATLSDEEIDGLLLMREEEKLAHDVYVTLYELWDLRVFDNISGAETVHIDSVLTLLDRYGIDDPGRENPAGVFENPAIQTLYDELTERGAESVVAALQVGAYIEELDIADLRARASEAEDIALVYGNLERGSRNHLRAFVRNLEQRGGTYAPTVLTAADFAEIVDTPTEMGDASSAAAEEPRAGRGYRGGRGSSSAG